MQLSDDDCEQIGKAWAETVMEEIAMSNGSKEQELPSGISNEEWLAAENQICFSGREAGIAFNARNPRGAFDIEVTIQCELNKALAQNAFLTAQVEELKENIEYREQHDEACKISSTTLDRLPASPDCMTTEEVAKALEYAPECTCAVCYWSGYTLRLKARAEKVEAERDAAIRQLGTSAAERMYVELELVDKVKELTLSLASANYAVKVGERDRIDLDAELAALRECAKVTYRVEGLVSGHRWRSIHVHDDLDDASKSLTPGSNRRIVEVITRERILDTTGGEG